jgi:hypothetical protein
MLGDMQHQSWSSADPLTALLARRKYHATPHCQAINSVTPPIHLHVTPDTSKSERNHSKSIVIWVLYEQRCASSVFQ